MREHSLALPAPIFPLGFDGARDAASFFAIALLSGMRDADDIRWKMREFPHEHFERRRVESYRVAKPSGFDGQTFFRVTLPT
jgi:hypothetical protein